MPRVAPESYQMVNIPVPRDLLAQIDDYLDRAPIRSSRRQAALTLLRRGLEAESRSQEQQPQPAA